MPYLREAVSLCHEMGNPYNEMHARDGLYQALWTINPDSARLELERFDLLKDSLYNNGASPTCWLATMPSLAIPV